MKARLMIENPDDIFSTMKSAGKGCRMTKLGKARDAVVKAAMHVYVLNGKFTDAWVAVLCIGRLFKACADLAELEKGKKHVR